ncbi:hypothetical protein ACFFRE_13510 [Aciditerrimonas ferrireducens]|jgi:hypothetical protein|uniref:Uncharacterized protein n=1 Tax=Aciditerrimonas ferrireducens TaxID=667306 RepID=A0ABV6C828_9ACTN|nr:hypothetical protein [Aciditerrimonas ferrireducens]MCK4176650.1 hypothetical protein [Aciditerrimonas ferrireducens]
MDAGVTGAVPTEDEVRQLVVLGRPVVLLPGPERAPEGDHGASLDAAPGRDGRVGEAAVSSQPGGA